MNCRCKTSGPCVCSPVHTTIRPDGLRGEWLAITIEMGGVSLTGTVKQAENHAATIGAFHIASCTVTGNDTEGWYVVLKARSAS